MAGSTPKGWEKDSEKLYIHESGVRIQRMLYRSKDGWYLVPVDLDQLCAEFEPTNEGRDLAFEAFDKGVLGQKPKKAKAAPKKPVKPAPGEDAEEKDKDKDEDDEEKEDSDEGDDD